MLETVKSHACPAIERLRPTVDKMDGAQPVDAWRCERDGGLATVTHAAAPRMHDDHNDDLEIASTGNAVLLQFVKPIETE